MREWCRRHLLNNTNTALVAVLETLRLQDLVYNGNVFETWYECMGVILLLESVDNCHNAAHEKKPSAVPFLKQCMSDVCGHFSRSA